MVATLGEGHTSSIELHDGKILYKKFPPFHHFDWIDYERLTSDLGIEVVPRGNSDNLTHSSGFNYWWFSSIKFDDKKRFFIGERWGKIALYLDVNTERFANGSFKLEKELYMNIWRRLDSFVVFNIVNLINNHPTSISQEEYAFNIGDLMAQLLLNNAQVIDDKN